MAEDKSVIEEAEEVMMTPEEKFEAAKKMECEILDTKVMLCNRIDTYTDLRDLYRQYFDKMPTWDVVMHYVDLCRALCIKMREIAGTFRFQDFLDENMEDPYAQLTRTLDQCEDDGDCFEALIRFNFVRPFGERALRLARLVQDDVDGVTEDGGE